MVCACPRRASPPLARSAGHSSGIEVALGSSAIPRPRRKLGTRNPSASEADAGTPHTPSPRRTTRRIQPAYVGSPLHQPGDSVLPSPQHIGVRRAKWIPPSAETSVGASTCLQARNPIHLHVLNLELVPPHSVEQVALQRERSKPLGHRHEAHEAAVGIEHVPVVRSLVE